MWRKIIRVLTYIPSVVGCMFIITFMMIALSPPKESSGNKLKLEMTNSNREMVKIREQTKSEVFVQSEMGKGDKKNQTPSEPSIQTENKSTNPPITVAISDKHATSKTEIEKNKTANEDKFIVYEHPFTYLHVPIDVCTSSGAASDPFLLLVVKSDVNHIAHRMAIRATWGITSKPGLKVVFLLGYSSLMKTFIQMESNTYKDIVQENFLDDYRNNTLKTIMGFNWVSSHCSGANFAFFVDDDYIVNIKYIWDHLHRIYDSGTRSIIMGYVWENAKPVRDKNSKWFIPMSVYSEETWPPYASGGSMIVTPDIVNKLSNQFKFVKPIFVDDVYLGILCKKLGITWVHESRFYVQYRPDLMGYLFSSHGYGTPKNLLQDWDLYHKKLDMVV